MSGGKHNSHTISIIRYSQLVIKHKSQSIKTVSKGYNSYCSDIFVTKKVKYISPWICVIEGLNVDAKIGTFYEQELQKTKLNVFRIEKMTKEKGDNFMLNESAVKIHVD